jgi:hypothetical protein
MHLRRAAAATPLCDAGPVPDLEAASLAELRQIVSAL